MHITRVKRKWSGDPSENRNKYIGGSDVGTILGLNPFKSAFELWAEKTGRIVPKDISDVESVWWGSMEENLVAKRFTMKTGKKVRRSNYEYTCEEFPYMIGHVDRMVVGEFSVLECKTTSSWNKFDYSKGETPPSHYAQTQFYMWITGAERAYLATKRDNQFYVNIIKKDPEFIENMVQKCIEFWHLVETDTPPEIDGSESTKETLNRMYQGDEEEEVADLAEFDEELDARDTISHNIKTMTTLKTEYENKVKAKMMTATRGESERYTVIWKEAANGSRAFRVIRKK